MTEIGTEARLLEALAQFFGKDRERTQHAYKVYSYTKCIAGCEAFSETERLDAVYASILHDVGIKIGEERFGKCSQRQQEEFGPPEAHKILEPLGVDADRIERISWIIGHHHQPKLVTESPGRENRAFCALIEADFIVNLEEGSIPLSDLPHIREAYFTTPTGRGLLDAAFSR
jgi:hypothetical protein